MSDSGLRPLRDVEDELATLSAHVSAGMSRILDLLFDFDLRGGWNGWSSCASWLAWRCGIDSRTAREHVRVARALNRLPIIRAAFARGELSYAKVRALTRVESPVNEDELLELAGELTASQLERALAACRHVRTVEAEETQRREALSCVWDDDGALVVRGRLAPEDGALLLKALEVAGERLWQARREAVPEPEGGSAEPPVNGWRPSRVEALLAVADAALAHDGERNGADRYQVVVHIDHTALTGGWNGFCELEDGPPVAPETGRRIACDSSIVGLVEKAGTPLKLGRKTRKISTALRRALKTRDAGCRFPGCTDTRFLHTHHIQHWIDDGETNIDNLILLCRRHHRLVHEGGYSVDADARFFDDFGNPIPHVPPVPRGRVDELRAMHDDLQLGPHTAKGGLGERIDLACVVDALNAAIKRHRGYPRPLLVWRPTSQPLNTHGRPIWPPSGTVRIDTVDENGHVLASEVLAENTTPAHAGALARERALDFDIDDEMGSVWHSGAPLRPPDACRLYDDY